jgi:hypothetical protein
MNFCWAKLNGNCNDISKEHILSKSLFNGKITIKGFPWCRNEEMEIGINSLVSKILCEKHNNDLSKYDGEMVKFWNIIDEMAKRLEKINRHGFRKKDFPIVYKINGFSLERWFLKTLVNIWMINEKDSYLPVSGIIPTLYQNMAFHHPFGLYNVVKLDLDIKTESKVIVMPLFNNIGGNKILSGGIFKVKGFNYMLVFPTAVNENNVKNGQLVINVPDEFKDEWVNANLNWHNQEIHHTHEIGKNNYLIHKLKFDYQV